MGSVLTGSADYNMLLCPLVAVLGRLHLLSGGPDLSFKQYHFFLKFPEWSVSVSIKMCFLGISAGLLASCSM